MSIFKWLRPSAHVHALKTSQTACHEQDNGSSAWDEFDPARYAKEQYAPMLPADIKMVEDLVAFYAHLPKGLDVGDFATGANLISLMVAAKNAKSITVHEFAAQNISYLKDVIKDPDHPDWDIWSKWWDKICEIDPSYADINIHQFLQECVFFEDGYDLLDENDPERQFDVVSSFYGAESITDKAEEHKKAVRKLVDHTKTGGHLVTAFLVGAKGYEAGGKFPAVDIDTAYLTRLLSTLGLVTSFAKEYEEPELGHVSGSRLGLVTALKP